MNHSFKIRAVLKIIILNLLAFTFIVEAGMPTNEQEIAIKVGFIYRFTKYVVWPESGNPEANPGIFRIAVVGDERYFSMLQKGFN
ncbi:MAG: YfiR/HmsC family protein [bacterium]